MLPALHSQPMTVTENPLESYKWEKRVLLVACSKDEVLSAMTTLNEARKGIDERDMIWFVLSGENPSSNLTEPVTEGMRDALFQTYFSGRNDGMRICLVGKDGGVKALAKVLDLDEIFTLVDSMPMRQSEMRSASATDL